LFDIFYGMLDTGCWIFDAGFFYSALSKHSAFLVLNFVYLVFQLPCAEFINHKEHKGFHNGH